MTNYNPNNDIQAAYRSSFQGLQTFGWFIKAFNNIILEMITELFSLLYDTRHHSELDQRLHNFLDDFTLFKEQMLSKYRPEEDGGGMYSYEPISHHEQLYGKKSSQSRKPKEERTYNFDDESEFTK